MIGFKGFNSDWTSKYNKYKYKLGEEYEEKDKIRICKNGFHFCEFPLDVFNYYQILTRRINSDRIFHFSKYSIVESDNKDIDPLTLEDTKRVTSKIKLWDKELSIPKLIDISVQQVKNKTRSIIFKIYKITKISFIEKNRLESYDKIKMAISKLSCALVYNGNNRSMAIGIGNHRNNVITDGNHSISISNSGNSISSGNHSISVKTNIGISSSHNICATTGSNSISVSNGIGYCISSGEKSICASNTTSISKSISYGENSIIANVNINNYQTDLISFGDKSIIASQGGQNINFEANGKNSICIYMGNSFYNERNLNELNTYPDDPRLYNKNGPLFKGKLGTLFIAPIYDNDLNITDFNIKKVDGKEIKENVFYMYVDNEFVEIYDNLELEDDK